MNITKGLRISYYDKYYVRDRVYYDCDLGGTVNGTDNIQQWLECQPDGSWLAGVGNALTGSSELAECAREYN